MLPLWIGCVSVRCRIKQNPHACQSCPQLILTVGSGSACSPSCLSIPASQARRQHCTPGITARGGSDRRKRSSDQASVSPVAFPLSCDVLQRSCYNFTSSQTRTEPCTASPAISHSSIYHPLHPTRQPLPCSYMDLTLLSHIHTYVYIH